MWTLTQGDRCFSVLISVFVVLLVCIPPLGIQTVTGASLCAQQPELRIAAKIDSQERITLRGSRSPMARPENESGRVSPEERLQGIGIVFGRTAAQEKDLQELIATQPSGTKAG